MVLLGRGRQKKTIIKSSLFSIIIHSLLHLGMSKFAQKKVIPTYNSIQRHYLGPNPKQYNCKTLELEWALATARLDALAMPPANCGLEVFEPSRD